MFEDDINGSSIPWAKRAETVRRNFVDAELARWREQVEKPDRTLVVRILDELTRDAVAKTTEDKTGRGYELDDRINTAWALATDLMETANASEEDAAKRETMLNFWRHEIWPGNVIKNKTYKLMFKSDIESVATRYVEADIRSPLFERTLVDMLIAQELYQFGHEMYHPDEIPGIEPRSPMKWPHPIWATIKNAFKATLVLGGAAFATGYLMSNNTVGDWGGWIIGACVVLWILYIGFMVVMLPWTLPMWHRERKRVTTVIDAMLRTYAQMQSDSVISAQHVLDSVKASAAAGVVWPSPLYVVLEDVIKRGGRL